MKDVFLTRTNLADILGVSYRTVDSWITKGKLTYETDKNGRRGFSYFQLMGNQEIEEMVNSKWDEELTVKPLRQYNSIELLTGGITLCLFTHYAQVR